MATTLLGRLGKIALKVQARANDRNLQWASDTNVLIWINECIAEVAAKDYWKTTGTLSLVAETSSYSLPTAFSTFRSLSKGDSAVTDSETNIPLVICPTKNEYNNVLLTVATGTPLYYYHESNVFYPAPVPDAALNLYVHYSYKPADRTSRDLKVDINQWVQDSGATGHFVDDSDPVVAQTLGDGNDCPEVVEGVTVSLVAGDFTITSITGDGDGTGEVTLSAATPTADVQSIYDASVTDPPWLEDDDGLMCVPYCLWMLFESDSTHAASEKRAMTNQAKFVRALNSMVGAAMPPCILRPYR